MILIVTKRLMCESWHEQSEANRMRQGLWVSTNLHMGQSEGLYYYYYNA